MTVTDAEPTLGLRRRFSTQGVDPYDELEWGLRDAVIVDHRTGEPAFEQRDVEFPLGWSQTASNIVAQKYFRGRLGTSEREHSLRQLIDRVVGTIGEWGERDGYFADRAEAETFRAELKALLVNQRVAFNSPVWFNIGVAGVPAQSSACFILSVDDSMPSILNWYREEGIIFKGGSGAGVNLSRIRSSKEHLRGGGTPSGPVSFMRGADASAGTIKSGGKTRRAAKMVILDADHPDIDDFVWCKAREERKARVLRDAGFDMELDGADSFSVQYQNANNSVRLPDEFMRGVLNDDSWELVAVTTSEVIETVRARDLMSDIAAAAWECADPGVQFDTTINRWHTLAATGPITASNPCFPGDALVHTEAGLIPIRELALRAMDGNTVGVYTHDATNVDSPRDVAVVSRPDAVMINGVNEIVRLRFSNGMTLRCTPNHAIFTDNRGWVRADELDPDDRVRTLDVPAPATTADRRFPVPTNAASYATRRGMADGVRLPEKWSPEFAHYLGWLVGDGCLSGEVAATIYGRAEDRDEIMPRHRALLADIVGMEYTPSTQANGTVQLRLGRAVATRFLRALGLSDALAPGKVVPDAVFEAPTDAVAAFLQGIFDADGCAHDGSKTRYVGLGSASEELLIGVQRLLTTFGIHSRIYTTRRAAPGTFRYVRSDGTEVSYESNDMFDLRISGRSIEAFEHHVGFGLSRKAGILRGMIRDHRRYDTDDTVRLVERVDVGCEVTYNLTEPRNHSYIVDGLVVRNCSEYLSVDDSACNLASVNLLPFLDEDGAFDVDGFRAAVEVTFVAQEILVGNSDYPTPLIGENTRRFRQLGLGFTNVGALLMSSGLAYDSDEGRAIAGAITALMTGTAYTTSTRMAARLGPFEGYEENKEHMLRVLEMHRHEAANLRAGLVPDQLLSAARRSWDDACSNARQVGVRNSQATVIAPTGTISFLLDCDTTGIEPDLGLVKTKRLVGGGTLMLANQSIPRALRTLGYDDEQIVAITDHVTEHHSVLGAPHLAPEHVAVFACSMGDVTIDPMGHVKMMAAVQPFISGAISKTINCPEETTAKEIEGLFVESWRLGLKAVAVYRDNCKVGQPLSTGTSTTSSGTTLAVSDEAEHVTHAVLVAPVPTAPVRERLPRQRRSRTLEFRVADCKGFVTVGEYDDGRPGELFIRVSKQGSTLAGIMDAFAISVSHGLQYGVPLQAFVEAYVGMRFEPAGMTDDPEVRIASSLMDYLFRRLALEYLTPDERARMGILSVSERLQPTLPGVEEAATTTVQGHDMAPDPPSHRDVPSTARDANAPLCMQCGVAMQRAGSCYACDQCGATSGCS
jgi:ribonucleoside-diphosphate reductase alpha chain